jgi:hypothetical protein
MRVLSVDWDFFIEENPNLDWGHNEGSGLFYDTVWHLRRSRIHEGPDGPILEKVDLTKLAPFVGDEAFLIGRSIAWATYQIGVADSHLHILEMIGDRRDLEIINIDAHHDIYYHDSAGDKPDCGNWGSALIQQGRVRSWRQIYPMWRQKWPENSLPREFVRKHKVKLRVEYNDEPLFTWKSADLVFLCRSSCWTPPEYDERFNRLIKLMGSEAQMPVRSLE